MNKFYTIILGWLFALPIALLTLQDQQTKKPKSLQCYQFMEKSKKKPPKGLASSKETIFKNTKQCIK